jgi:Protein of unknown function (DUF5672)
MLSSTTLKRAPPWSLSSLIWLALIAGMAIMLIFTTAAPMCNNFKNQSSVMGANSKALLIVEPRRHELLRYSLHNVHSIMPPEYDLYIFHGHSNAKYVREQATMLREGRRVFYRALNDSTAAFTQEQYNLLFKNVTFWGEIHAEDVLVFQTDSVLCANSPFRIHNFEHYSYIGCSLGETYGPAFDYWGGNAFYGVGGLTFRKKSFHLDCIRRYASAYPASFAEDVFFSACLQKGHGHKPENATVLNRFCSQATATEPSFAAHKISDEMLWWNPHDIPKLLKHCPEALATVPQLLCDERVKNVTV